MYIIIDERFGSTFSSIECGGRRSITFRTEEVAEVAEVAEEVAEVAEEVAEEVNNIIRRFGGALRRITGRITKRRTENAP
tara:strand:+ start:300 stop:539 length:240 start_codon:yes stop_codon:yes gene_type:complete